MNEQIKAVILAGGKSIRMGKDKATLELSGINMIQHITKILNQAGIDQVIVSRNNKTGGIADEIANKGPLSGIHATAKNSLNSCSHIIYTAIDMPALSAKCIRRLIESASQKEVVHFSNYPLPFKLKVTPPIINSVESILLNGKDYSLKSFHRALSTQCLAVTSEEKKQLLNINTPSQWQTFLNNGQS